MLKKTSALVLAVSVLTLLSACAARPPGLASAVKSTAAGSFSFKGNLQFTCSDGYLGNIQISGETSRLNKKRSTAMELSVSSSGQSYLEDSLYCLSDDSGTQVYLGLTDALRQAADPSGSRQDLQSAQTVVMPTVAGAGADALLKPFLQWFEQNASKAAFISSESVVPTLTSGTYTKTLAGTQVQKLLAAFVTKPVEPVLNLYHAQIDHSFAGEFSKASSLPQYALSADYENGGIQAIHIQSAGWKPVSASNADPYTGTMIKQKIDTGLDLEILLTRDVSSITSAPSSATEYVSGQS